MTTHTTDPRWQRQCADYEVARAVDAAVREFNDQGMDTRVFLRSAFTSGRDGGAIDGEFTITVSYKRTIECGYCGKPVSMADAVSSPNGSAHESCFEAAPDGMDPAV